ncbi:MAG: penicillin acylase family protein, partial [Chitinophagaceae bacterium]|nr:penicillin acylase family protein [Chitinophagaceae bacterium]
QQAKFPARWEGQGLYLMPGDDTNYMWQGFIPQQENPHIINPASGFIQSANQRPVDSTYPYFIPGNYITARGRIIAKRLEQMQQITPKDMMQLQNDYYSITAANIIPLFLKYLDVHNLNGTENKYLNEVRQWNFNATPDSKATTIYQAWLDTLSVIIWSDEFAGVQQPNTRPDEETLIEALLKDSSYKYIDNISTSQVETITQQVTYAFKLAVAALDKDPDHLIWWKHKNPTILHLLRNSVTSWARTGLHVGGWSNTINAVTTTHGPSWRMIVHLTKPIEAYGVYPGGQSGNPASKYYDNFIDTWVNGKYFRLWMMKETEAKDKRIKWKMTFTNS